MRHSRESLAKGVAARAPGSEAASVQCTVSNEARIAGNEQLAMSNEQWKILGESRCAPRSVQSTVYRVQCTEYSVQSTVYRVQCTVYSERV
jgi:hypothetical protein